MALKDIWKKISGKWEIKTWHAFVFILSFPYYFYQEHIKNKKGK